MAVCKTCGRTVFWGRTEASGKNMPCDNSPVDDGNVLIVGYEGGKPLFRVMRKGEDPPEEVNRYVSHFTTCPQRDEHRRRA